MLFTYTFSQVNVYVSSILDFVKSELISDNWDARLLWYIIRGILGKLGLRYNYLFLWLEVWYELASACPVLCDLLLVLCEQGAQVFRYFVPPFL